MRRPEEWLKRVKRLKPDMSDCWTLLTETAAYRRIGYVSPRKLFRKPGKRLRNPNANELHQLANLGFHAVHIETSYVGSAYADSIWAKTNVQLTDYVERIREEQHDFDNWTILACYCEEFTGFVAAFKNPAELLNFKLTTGLETKPFSGTEQFWKAA